MFSRDVRLSLAKRPESLVKIRPMYTAPIADVTKRLGMAGYHFYADDTQIYMSFNPPDVLQSKSLIEECIQDVQLWMVANKLKLNGDKTKLLVLTAPRRPQPPLDSIKIGVDLSAKNTGVWLDSVLSMDEQIISVKLPFSTFVT